MADEAKKKTEEKKQIADEAKKTKGNKKKK